MLKNKDDFREYFKSGNNALPSLKGFGDKTHTNLDVHSEAMSTVEPPMSE